MKTVSDIIQAVGRPRIKAAYGIGDRALQLYAQQNSLPSSWYDGLEKMAGVSLPRDLFTFKDVRAFADDRGAA